jgi:hypothetical protein
LLASTCVLAFAFSTGAFSAGLSSARTAPAPDAAITMLAATLATADRHHFPEAISLSHSAPPAAGELAGPH